MIFSIKTHFKIMNSVTSKLIRIFIWAEPQRKRPALFQVNTLSPQIGVHIVLEKTIVLFCTVVLF